jgi:hypothetical protein
MVNGIGMEDVVFYAKVGPENLKKLGASSEAAIFQMIFKDTMANMPTYYSELREIDGFGAWMINEAIGSLIGGGYITTNPKEAYASSSASSGVPSAVVAANEAVPSVSSVSAERYSPPDILIPGGGSNSSSNLSPEIADAIGIDYRSSDQEIVGSHSKKDAKKGNMMNLVNGLSTGRLIDNLGTKKEADVNDDDERKENHVGMMETMSFTMPSISLDGRKKEEDEE